jgi:hypothetical protein
VPALKSVGVLAAEAAALVELVEADDPVLAVRPPRRSMRPMATRIQKNWGVSRRRAGFTVLSMMR